MPTLPVLVCLLFAPLTALLAAAELAPVIGNIAAQVYFSPNGGATEAIVVEIGKAKTEIRVQAYSFTSKPIASALRDAKARGVDVSVILDTSQRTEKYSGADFIAHAGIPVVIDETPAIAHSKVMVIDRVTVVTGSFNFTSAAENKNVENLLVLRSAPLAVTYLANWGDRHAQSVAFVPKSEREGDLPPLLADHHGLPIVSPFVHGCMPLSRCGCEWAPVAAGPWHGPRGLFMERRTVA